jgi:hypothetical protein
MEPVIESSPAIQQDEAPAASRLVPALIGGVIGAVLGSAIWAGVGVATGYESTHVALLVGVCVGGGVRLLGGKATILHQVIAIVLAALGVLVGKYLNYYYLGQREFIEEFGQAIWDELALSVTSLEMIGFFIEDLPAMTEFLDIVFIFLAMLAAWFIPVGKKQQEEG